MARILKTLAHWYALTHSASGSCLCLLGGQSRCRDGLDDALSTRDGRSQPKLVPEHQLKGLEEEEGEEWKSRPESWKLGDHVERPGG